MITPVQTPYHLFDKSVTVKAPEGGQDTSGAWYSVAGEVEVVGTWAANIQPTSSFEGIEYQQRTGRKTYDVFLPGTDNDGLVTTRAAFHMLSIITYTVAGESKRLEVVGEVRDLIENGCVWQCVASEFTD